MGSIEEVERPRGQGRAAGARAHAQGGAAPPGQGGAGAAAGQARGPVDRASQARLRRARAEDRRRDIAAADQNRWDSSPLGKAAAGAGAGEGRGGGDGVDGADATSVSR